MTLELGARPGNLVVEHRIGGGAHIDIASVVSGRAAAEGRWETTQMSLMTCFETR
jgi:hypothetical protein